MRVRKEMARRGVDCLLLNGSSARWNEMNANIRYLAGYADPISAACYALFPGNSPGTLITQMGSKRSVYAMSWFEDIRAGKSADLPAIVEARLSELGLGGGTLGLVSIVFRDDEIYGLPWNQLEVIRQKLPNLKLVDVSDLFFDLRSVKSDEEIQCLERSAGIADVGFEAHVRGYRPGMTEAEYYAAIVHAMDAAGAEPPTFLLMESGPLSGPWLAQDPLSSKGVLCRGDYVVSEASPKWAGYQAQELQCAVIGAPTAEMKELVKHGVEVWHRMTELLRPGNTLHQAERGAMTSSSGRGDTSVTSQAASFRTAPMRAWVARIRSRDQRRFSRTRPSWVNSARIAVAPSLPPLGA